ncbi:uncharacterized protein LOC121329766 [Polyodon spathula]|uniref:uncharacterized protein LOC121329766 n=1 Tax=Polyodon spathula TaxID=7913 RepID=UPI001B7D9D8B|nr:uncharacterized protein LOC121329766 [Polyodon spathula]
MHVKMIWQAAQWMLSAGKDDLKDREIQTPQDNEETAPVLHWLRTLSPASLDCLEVGGILRRSYGHTDLPTKLKGSLQSKDSQTAKPPSTLSLAKATSEPDVETYKKTKLETPYPFESESEPLPLPASFRGVYKKHRQANEATAELKETCLAALLEDVRGTLSDLTRERQSDRQQHGRMLQLTTHLREHVKHFITLCSDCNVPETLDSLKPQTNDTLTIIKQATNQAGDYQETAYQPNPGHPCLLQCCAMIDRETAAALSRKAQPEEESVYREYQVSRQKVQELRDQLHQQRLHSTVLESNIRLLKDELIRLQNHISLAGATNNSSTVMELYKRIVEICKHAQQLTAPTGSTVTGKPGSNALTQGHHSESK